MDAHTITVEIGEPIPTPQNGPTPRRVHRAGVGLAALADRLGVLPPSSNRGVSEPINGEGSEGLPEHTTCIDWFTFCLDLESFLGGIGLVDGKAKRALERLHADGTGGDLIAEALGRYYGLFDSGLRIQGEVKGGRFYHASAALVDVHGHRAGTIEFGGEHTKLKTGAYTARIELTGRGCEQFEGRTAEGAHRPRPWALLRAKLEGGPTAWVTRVDVAADDYLGKRGVQDALKLWENGKFDSRGQHPNGQLISDLGSAKGCTFYVGSNQSAKMLRVYEKGKQLGHKASNWVRWELQLRAQGGLIPLDVLTSPAATMRGAYAALEFVSDFANRAHQVKQRTKATAASAVRWLARQYGGTLNWLRKRSEDREQFLKIFDAIARPTVPPWAKETMYPADWSETLRAAVFGEAQVRA